MSVLIFFIVVVVVWSANYFNFRKIPVIKVVKGHISFFKAYRGGVKISLEPF